MAYTVKRLSALLALAVVLLTVGLAALPGSAQARDPWYPIGVVHVGETSYNCTTFADLKQKLEAQKNKEVVVEVACDWNAAEDVDVSSPLVIPENARVTLNLNGYAIDRGLAQSKGWKNDGEVILVKSGAMLTVNGGSGDSTHEAYVYRSLGENDSPVQTTVQGALITGGASTNSAGGIHVNKGATVTLNDVTVAGCRAQKAGSSKGYGGGMYLTGGSITVNLNNSTITGCYAQEDGGGIYADGGGVASINLSNAHVDANFANSDGGGIDADGKGTRIVGDVTPVNDSSATGVSTISNNSCSERGGGILAWNCDITVSRLAIEGNHANNGGGIYAHRDKVQLDRLAISGNEATAHGGGVYFSIAGATASAYDGPSSIDDCAITGNVAQRYGGVFCDDYSIESGASKLRERERRISGATVIKDNTAGDGSEFKNLCVASYNWMYKSETFYLAEGADIHASYEHTGEATSRPFAKDRNCAKYLTCDQPDHGFIYSVEDRCIVWVRSEFIPAVPTAKTVNAADASNASGKESAGDTSAGKIGTVGAGGAAGSDYDWIRGFYMHDGPETLTAFYYSDGLFYGDPTKYNEHLGTLSWAWTIAASYLNKFEEADENGNTYYNKHAAGRQFLADIGCADQDIYINDFMLQKPGTDTIGVTIGHKELAKADGTKTGDILVPIAIRSQGYEAEWVSNVTLGSAVQMSPTKEAMGFASAANQAFAEVEYYLKKYDLEDAYKAGKVKFWVSGYSRGGATANLTSKRLVDKIAKDGCSSQVFGYTCEGAKGGTDAAEVAGCDYTCIHNMVNLVDIVPYVAPEQMGFKRYGVDHYVPGSAAGAITTRKDGVPRGGASGPGAVTTRADNKAYYTKTSDYNSQKELMKQQLLAMNSGMQLDDYFQPQAMDFISTSGFLHVYDEGNYDDNHIEDFVPNFLWLLQEQAATSRDMYAIEAYSLDGAEYPTIQKALQDTIGSFMNGGMGGFVDEAGNIKDGISTFSFSRFLPSISNNSATPGIIDFSMAGLYFDVVGKWKSLKPGEKAAWTRNLWNALVKTGAVDKLSAEDKENLENNFPTLINMVFNIVDMDYNYKPKENKDHEWAKGSNESMMYLPTFMAYSDYILLCHAPDINIAWVRSYDSWFNNDKNEYTISADGYSVKAPKAFATVEGARQALSSTSDNNLVGTQRITLENDEIVGEAVYYDLVDVTDGASVKLASNSLYRGSIDLALESATTKSYEITTYDMSYGVKSDAVTYRVNLGDGQHKVIVRDLAADGETSADAGEGASDPNATGQSIVIGQGASSDGDGLGLVTGSVAGDWMQAAADEDEYRVREYTFEEGSKALVQAGVPASRYFKTWKVEVLDRDGAVLSEDDVLLPDDAKTSETAVFTMPEVDSVKYPQGYQLRLTAQYGTMITAIKLNPTAPATGEPLPGAVPASLEYGDSTPAAQSFSPTWFYTEDGAVVPASGDARPETAYRAHIVIEQDPDHDIVFDVSGVEVGLADGQDPDKVTATVVRNTAEGSVTVELAFAATGAGPPPEPGVLQFEVDTFDLNTGERIAGTTPVVYRRARAGDTVFIVAPVIDGMVFAGWDFARFDSDVTPPDDLSQRRISLTLPNKGALEGETIIANYLPAVSLVEANLYDGDDKLLEPEAGSTGPASWEMLVTVGGVVYSVNPATLTMTWAPELPEDGRFVPLVDYLGSVKAAVKEVEGEKTISAKRQGSSEEYRDISIAAAPADDFTALFNGGSENVSVDFDELTVSKMFHDTPYVLEAVKQPGNISGVAYDKGKTAEQVKGLLPTSTKILTAHGIELDATITWDDPVTEGGSDEYAAKVWTASGTVKLPETVANPRKVDVKVSVSVSVNDAGTALSPTSSLPSGEYLYNQETKLDAGGEAGATYYTTDGSDPRESSTRKRYDGEAIHIDRKAANQVVSGKKTFVVNAYTTGSGQRDSDVATYEYVFADIPVPEGAMLEYDGTQQVGVWWGAFYKLEAVAEPGKPVATIDTEGNAVAIDPGVYRVKATLDTESGADRWATGGEQGWSEDDQIVEFSITGETDDSCTIAVYSDPSEGGSATVSLKGDDASGASSSITVDKGAEVTVRAKANSGYGFVGWTTSSSETDAKVSEEAEYTFTATGGSLLAANFVRVYQVRWLDGDGSVLHEASFAEGEAEPSYPQDGKTPTKAATQACSYTFTGWDAGTMSDGVKTYKPLFDEVLNKYAVTFVDDDGTVLKGPDTYDYGTKAADIAKPADPTKPADAQYAYSFAGWSPALADVTADATYTAVYDKVPVPAPSAKAKITFDAAGGLLDGKTTLVIEANVGDAIEIPKAPVRDGYTFKYWQGSEYYPGEKYVVTGDHVFKAVWEKNQAPTPAPTPKGDTPSSADNTDKTNKNTANTTAKTTTAAKTGEVISPVLPVALAVLAAVALVVAIVIAKRRKRD